MNSQPILQPGQPVGDALRAIAGHLLTDAHDIIEDRARDSALAVHDIRRAMKRWRSMLRLLAPFLDETGRNLRDDARELSRKLSQARDAQSALDAFHDAVDATLHLPPTLPHRVFASFPTLAAISTSGAWAAILNLAATPSPACYR